MQRGEYFIVVRCSKERDMSYFTFTLKIVASLHFFPSRLASCKRMYKYDIYFIYFPILISSSVLLHFSITREMDLIFSLNIYGSLIYLVIKI